MPTLTDLRDHRIECFEDLGFTLKEAEKLADATERAVLRKDGVERVYDSPLHHGKVRKMLEGGAKHKLVIHLLCD